MYVYDCVCVFGNLPMYLYIIIYICIKLYYIYSYMYIDKKEKNMRIPILLNDHSITSSPPSPNFPIQRFDPFNPHDLRLPPQQHLQNLHPAGLRCLVQWREAA